MQKTLCKSLLFCLLTVSCTIKEDRSECPCILTLDFSLCHEHEEELTVRGWTGSEALFDDRLFVKDFPDGMKVSVPKGAVNYSAYTTVPSYHTTGQILSCPKGQQAEPLFAYRKTVTATGETISDRVILHKQFAVLTITFKEEPGSDTVDMISVKADFNGLSITDLSPEKGEFVCTAAASEGRFKILVPRQGKGKIVMQAFSGGEYTRTENLASILDGIGYRWDADDLEDVWLDFENGDVRTSVGVEPWDGGEIYKETI